MPGTGGLLFVDTSIALLVVISPAGPEKLICMLLEMPGPNISSDVLVPRKTVSPVEKAVLPPTLSACALGAGFDAGVGTVIFTPEAVVPAATVTMTGMVTAPFPLPPPVVLVPPPPPPPPQPAMRDRQKGTIRAFQIFESTGVLLIAVQGT